jgi:maleate isomerase
MRQDSTPDALGWRAKFGTLAPSTNTIVQPDYDDLRPVGVTNHYARIRVSNLSVSDNDSFRALTDAIASMVDVALDDVMTADPDHIIMGMSAVAFYGGVAGAQAFADRISARAGGLGVSTGSLSTAAALKLMGVGSISFLSPYFPIANNEVRRFFTESGFRVLDDICLKCASPRAIAQVPTDELVQVLTKLKASGADAIVQVGTNLSMLRLAAAAELFLGIPVIAINAATYWHALRSLNITDKIGGFGRLLEHY